MFDIIFPLTNIVCCIVAVTFAAYGKRKIANAIMISVILSIILVFINDGYYHQQRLELRRSIPQYIINPDL